MLTPERLLGAVVLLKAVDVVDRGPSSPLFAVVLLAWAAAGVAVLLRPSRAAWSVLAVTGVLLAVDFPGDLRRQHLVLLIGLAVAAAVARDAAERRLLWRTQLTVLYAVAALAKANETFLGGDVLALALVTGPLGLLPPPWLLAALSAALVATEAALAVLLWVRPRAALVVAAALHAGALVVASADGRVGLRLVVFGGAAVLACAAAARPARPAARSHSR